MGTENDDGIIYDYEREAPWGCPNAHRRRLLLRSWWLQPHYVTDSRVRKVSIRVYGMGRAINIVVTAAQDLRG